jgi:RND family efflux transporter MFP subunit
MNPMARASAQIPAVELPERGSKRPRSLFLAVALICIVLAIAAVTLLVRNGPVRVELAAPRVAIISETITGSGTVYGVHETLVGAQLSGVVQRLDVREGDRVTAGQVLAIVNDRVVQAQVAEAQANLNTANAQLLQTLKHAPESDIRAASEQVTQALAQTEQQRAVVVQTQRAERQSRALLGQLQSEAALAAKQYDRAAALYRQGYTSHADYDNAQTQLHVAQKRVAAQESAVQSAQANERAAAATLNAAQANTATQRARMDTLVAGAQAEDIEVSRKRVRQAEESLRAARRQADNAVVRAPFTGTISAINAESGQTVGALGVAQLVSKELEIRLDVDEVNLGELAVGQKAALSSNAFPGTNLPATVTRIGASIDRDRGTVIATLTPAVTPAWLRSGQTVDVEILTARAVRRLLVPPGAISRSGDRTVVYVVKDGRAVEKPVVVRAATSRGVPVLLGLNENDRVIVNAAGVTAGARVRVK